MTSSGSTSAPSVPRQKKVHHVASHPASNSITRTSVSTVSPVSVSHMLRVEKVSPHWLTSPEPTSSPRQEVNLRPPIR
ncbi:uncharacterized protein L3040_005379 [Drepanopeziza brunnea f. sp. 'multigermtubi']|uniref:uncharacterized protein n=1 Tax=Drepanopeziza brunnea f. sp. 'multigermtubi' TaxID=698441 RepID=UPI0023A0C772|nr:hypothetical protein L3040_005379 [Drepanopeziza brunnea f. sp. 'multigermtubi']